MVGGIISLLLSVLAYFLHLLILDFRKMREEQRELRDLCVYLKAEQRIIKEWLRPERVRRQD